MIHVRIGGRGLARHPSWVSSNKPRRSKKTRPPLVLVVDDYEDTRLIYAETLRFAGFDVAEAENGQDAIELATKIAPDVVIMDLAMPVMDGWEATRRLKSDPRTRDIHVVAVTGHAEPEHRVLASEAGCDDFVSKPLLPQHLVSRIKTYLGAA